MSKNSRNSRLSIVFVSLVLTIVLLFGLVGVVNSATTAPAPARTGPLSGLWTVTQGAEKNHYMQIEQIGNKLNATWDDRTFITGTITNNIYFVGTYCNEPYVKKTNKIAFNFSSDGQTFKGFYHWSIKDHPLSGVKNTAGTAKLTATPTSMDKTNFAGTWKTTKGDLKLIQVDDKVTGTLAGTTIIGKVTGNTLTARCRKATFPSLFWDFNLTMSPDGKAAEGFWTWARGTNCKAWGRK